MTAVSASMIDIFDDCPYRYKLSYLDRIKTAQTPHLLFGDLVHRILEQFNIKARTIRSSEDTLQEKYKDLMFEIGETFFKDVDSSLFEKVKYTKLDTYNVMLFGYVKFFVEKKLYERAYECEKNFLIDLTPNIKLRGKIDLWISPNILIDFKTSREPTPTEKLQYAPQTLIYSLTLRNEPVKFAYLYLKHLDQIKAFQIAQDKSSIEAALVKKIRWMLSQTFFEKRGKFCAFCPYKRYCTST